MYFRRNMMLKLKDKVIIITGAAGGIGSAAAHLFAQQGAALVLTDIQKESLEKLGTSLKQPGGKIMVVEHDVTDPESWQSLIEKVRQEYGRVDVLVNNAGVVQPGAVEKMALEKIQQLVSVNLLGTIYGSRAAVSTMKDQHFGKVVNIASLGGIVPMPGEAVYSATKFAIRGYTLSLYAELSDSPVEICAVCPDSVNTPQLDYELQYDEASLSFVGKALHPETVARGILKAIVKKKSEILIPSGMGVFYRLGMGIPRIFFFLYPYLKKIGLRQMKKRRENSSS